jgi:Protease inhibitor Inh
MAPALTRSWGHASLMRMQAEKLAIVAAIAVTLGGSAALAQGTQQDAQQDTQQGAKPGQSQDLSGSEGQNPQAQNPQQRSGPEDPVNAMLGAWEFSDADHNRICHFNFRGEPASGGRRLDVDKGCVSLFPSTKDISGWAVNTYGDLSLLDSHGEAVIALTQVESGMYDGFSPGEGRYVLQTAASAPVHLAEDMVGDWAITRGAGKPICTLTLVNSPLNSPAASGALTLRLKAGCDPLVTRFNPNAWRMDQGELVFLSPRGQSWQFVETDPDTWQRVPESADLILLVRQ